LFERSTGKLLDRGDEPPAARALCGMDADDETVGLVEPTGGEIGQQIFRGMMVDGHVNRPRDL
jgi:hypothetical protein